MRLLIVDDSALMRKYLRELFMSETDIEIATARNGVEAIAEVHKFEPDVVTLDINMPEMDGLTCLSHIMTEAPRPVVMLSSLTEKGALATLEALQLGAVDFIPKPGGTVSLNIKDIGDVIISKVRAAARSRVRRQALKTQTAVVQAKTETQVSASPASIVKNLRTRVVDGAVLIGVSTGGPRTLEDILTELPVNFPLPIVIAQHMPATFTGALAARLNNACKLNIQEVTRPTPLAAGNVYIGRGDADVVLSKRLGEMVAMSVPAEAKFRWHPSVERMVQSALEHYKAEQLIGVQLTGMGDDGAEAMAQLFKKGGRTIAESEESAVVFGMPQELINKGGAERVLPASQIALQLRNWV